MMFIFLNHWTMKKKKKGEENRFVEYSFLIEVIDKGKNIMDFVYKFDGCNSFFSINVYDFYFAWYYLDII